MSKFEFTIPTSHSSTDVQIDTTSPLADFTVSTYEERSLLVSGGNIGTAASHPFGWWLTEGEFFVQDSTDSHAGIAYSSENDNELLIRYTPDGTVTGASFTIEVEDWQPANMVGYAYKPREVPTKPSISTDRPTSSVFKVGSGFGGTQDYDTLASMFADIDAGTPGSPTRPCRVDLHSTHVENGVRFGYVPGTGYMWIEMENFGTHLQTEFGVSAADEADFRVEPGTGAPGTASDFRASLPRLTATGSGAGSNIRFNDGPKNPSGNPTQYIVLRGVNCRFTGTQSSNMIEINPDDVGSPSSTAEADLPKFIHLYQIIADGNWDWNEFSTISGSIAGAGNYYTVSTAPNGVNEVRNGIHVKACEDCGVWDSYIYGIHSGEPLYNETHGFLFQGPVKRFAINNCFIEGGGMPVFVGDTGGDKTAEQAHPRDITCWNNHYYNRPEWCDTGLRASGGTSGFWDRAASLKNMSECKDTFRWHNYDIVMENITQGSGNQNGAAIKVKTASSGSSNKVKTAQSSDVIFENIVIKNAQEMVEVAPMPLTERLLGTRRVTIRNILGIQIGPASKFANVYTSDDGPIGWNTSATSGRERWERVQISNITVGLYDPSTTTTKSWSATGVVAHGNIGTSTGYGVTYDSQPNEGQGLVEIFNIVGFDNISSNGGWFFRLPEDEYFWNNTDPQDTTMRETGLYAPGQPHCRLMSGCVFPNATARSWKAGTAPDPTTGARNTTETPTFYYPATVNYVDEANQNYRIDPGESYYNQGWQFDQTNRVWTRPGTHPIEADQDEIEAAMGSLTPDTVATYGVPRWAPNVRSSWLPTSVADAHNV